MLNMSLVRHSVTDKHTDTQTRLKAISASLRQLAYTADNIDCALVDACKDRGVRIFYYIR